MSIKSEEDICNLALMRLGTNPITSLAEGSTAANACTLVYDFCRESLLREYTWNFSIRYTSLASSSPNPVFGYKNSFPLPPDFIRLHKIFKQTSQYMFVDNNIYTNQKAPLAISYVSDTKDPTRFDILFVKCLVLSIIIAIGARVQGEAFNPAPYIEEYERALLSARRVDAQDVSPPHLVADTFQQARMGDRDELLSVGVSYMGEVY